MRSDTAIHERDEGGGSVVHVAGVRGCHRYGRSTAHARARIFEALGLFVDDADRADIADDVRVPAEARRAIARYRRARAVAERAQAEASERSRAAVRALVGELGLSTRDAAELTDLAQLSSRSR